MVSSVPFIETLVGLAMIGVAGVIRYRHRPHRRHRHVVHPGPLLRVRWLPVPLATCGLLLIVYTWTIGSATTQAPDTMPSDVPGHASAPVAGEPARRGILLVRGTPADDDTATEDGVQDYSRRLGTLIAEAMVRPPLSLALAVEALDAEQWRALRKDPAAVRQWCGAEPPVDFVVVLGVSALRLQDGIGYAPWREPEDLIVSCDGEQRVVHRGRATERLGDRVPYEQALTEDLRTALAKLGIGGTR